MSGTNFVGSRISLISKAGIRYLGTLVDINASESTVALENVLSFGTENRPCPTPCAASKIPYSYIKFRGTDIADLHVFEQTQPQDPAIIEASQAPNGHHIPGGPMPGSEMSPGVPNVAFNASYSPNNSANQPNVSGNFAGYPSSQTAPTPANSFAESGDQAKPASPPPRQVSQEGGKPVEGEEGEDTREQGGPRRGRGGRDGNQRKNSYNNNRRYREGMPYTNKTLSFDADFDFESSNAKFDKGEIVEEFAKKLAKMSLDQEQADVVPVEAEEGKKPNTVESSNNPEDDDQFYDKTKSFFDTISCEALEKEKGERRRPPSWHQERNLNTETFGEGVQSYQRRSYQGSYRGRGGMNGNYGQGGYGGSGGGGGGGYNSGNRYGNYGNRSSDNNNSYYRGGYRNSGYRQHNDGGFRQHNDGFRPHDDGFRQQSEGGYNRQQNDSQPAGGYNQGQGGFRQQSDGYQREGGRDQGYQGRRENNFRENNNFQRSEGGYRSGDRAPATQREYSDRNNHFQPRRDNNYYRGRDNNSYRNYPRGDESNRNYTRGEEGQGRASYRRIERSGRPQAQTEAA